MSDPEIARLERQVRQASADPSLLVRLGLAYERTQRLRAAFLAFSRARAIWPDDGVVHAHWARLGGGQQGQLVIRLGSSVRSGDRVSAATMLGVCGDELALEALQLSLVKDAHFVVRQAAAAALGILGETRASEALVDALTDENRWVRCAAVVSLHRLHVDPEGFAAFAARDAWLDPRVAEWLAWWKDQVP